MALLHRALLLTASVVALMLPGVAHAGLAVPGAPGIQILPPQEVMERFTEYDGNRLLFREKDGTLVRMITSTDDPEVLNPGEGKFYSADTEELQRSLEAIPPEFLRDLALDIYVLPFPRSGQLASSASDGVIYLSPGVRPLEPRHVHFLLAHEIGHAVHRHFLPDTDTTGWTTYAELRGISDRSKFNEDSIHANRPHEIFAEDFRVLFGGDLAAGDGSIENSDITASRDVFGLGEFIRGLVGGESMLAQSSLRLAPNPATPGGTVSILGAMNAGEIREAVLIDATGRKIASLVAREGAGDLALQLPRRNDLGMKIAAGAYWVRLTDSRGQGEVLPIRVLR